MALPLLSNTLTSLEPALWLCAVVAYLRLKSQLRLPSFGVFLGVKLSGSLALAAIHSTHLAAAPGDSSQIYFFTYWISCFASDIALFFALQELFSHSMASLPGLSRLGVLGFRWAAV